MKRRVKSFLLAILMVFTILPTNFTTVEADNKDIQIIVASNIGESLDKKDLKIQLFSDDSEISSENIKSDYNYELRKNVIKVGGLEYSTEYTLKISYAGYLEYENQFIPEEIEEKMEVTLIKDPFSRYDFSNIPSTLELRQSGLAIETYIEPKKPDGFSEDISSSNTDVADIKDGVLNLKSAGNTTITACLSKELKKPDGTLNGKVYKLISKDVTIKKNSHKLVVKSGTPDTEIYTKQNGTVTYVSDDSKYDGTITYSFSDANSAGLVDTIGDFKESGQWKAKDTYGEVTVNVVAPETDKYEEVKTSYTTKIVQYDYSDYSQFWTIDGDTFKNEGRIYTKISGIVPSKDNKDGNTYVIKLQGDDDSMWSKDGIAADRLSLIQGTNNIPVSIGKGVFEGDEIKDVVETGETTISFNYDSEAPQVSEFDFSAGCRPNENGWNNGDITVNIAAKDTGSDVGAIKYQLTGADGKVLIDKSDVSLETNNGLASGSIKIPYNYQGDNLVLKAWVYDNTGHECQTKELKIKNDSVINEPAVNLNSKIRFFNKNVDVNISAGDDLSGIASVKYVVLQDGDTLDWSKGEEIFDGIAGDKSFEKSITIDKGIGFAKKLNVYVMVTDMAGNVKSACLNDDEKFTIDITAPNVGVRFCDKDDDKADSAPVTRAGTIDYYNKAKTAVITVDDRNFDADSVKIMVQSDDGKETDIAKKKDAVEGVTIGDWNNNSINVNFDCGHTYSLYVIATDKAGNSNTVSDIKVSGDRSLSFLLDNEIPSGNFSLIGYRDGSKKTDFGNWADRVLNKGELSYNVYSNMVTYMEGNVCDSLSRVKYAGYIYSDAVLSDTQLMSADLKWNELELGGDYEFKNQIPAVDRKFIIYVKITDNCDNTRYISSDGVVYDETVPVVENVSISDETKPNDDSWNRKDININVSATDNLSGIKKVRYTVTCGKKTLIKDESSFSLNDGNPCDVSGQFTIPSGDDFINDGRLTVNVTAEDMSGNLSEIKSIPVNLDSKAPDGEVKDMSDKAWITEDKVYTVTAQDETSGIRRITYSVKRSDDDSVLVDGEDISYDAGTAAGNNRVTGKIILPSKDHRFDCRDLVITTCITDMADNETTIENNTSIDTTAPTADIDIKTKANDAGWYNDDIQFETSAYDATSGIESVTYTVTAPDGSVIGDADRAVTFSDFEKGNGSADGSFVIKRSDSPLYDYGALVITTTTRDVAGNETKKSKTINVDTTKPDAELVGDDSANKDGWHNQKVDFTLNVSDATSGIKNASYT